MRYLTTAFLVASLAPGARAQDKTFDSHGVKIAYLDVGQGEAVVLLHGFGGSAPETWTQMPLAKTQFASALKGYRVLAIDHRGHGKSDKPHDPKKYGAEMAEDIVRLLDHAKVKKAHVVGYSMGTFVAGKLLATHPDRLLSVTFGGGGPVLQPPKSFTDVIDATAASLEAGKGITPLILSLTPEGAKPPSQEEAAAFSAMYIGKKDQKALAAVLRGQAGWTVTEADLKGVKVPVLFVYGSKEAPFLKDIAKAAKKALPPAETVVVENGDHGSTMMSAEFREAVVKFLKAHKE